LRVARGSPTIFRTASGNPGLIITSAVARPPELLGPRSGRVAAARKLLRRSARREQGLFLLEGPSAVSAALAAGEIRELFATSAAAERHPSLLALAASSPGVRLRLISDESAAALSETVTPQGLIAVAPLPQMSLAQALAAPPRLSAGRVVVVLVEARDPGNAGTVIRTADAAGADLVVLAGESVDPWSGKCVRASAGSVLHLPIVDGVGIDEVIAALRLADCRIAATEGSGGDDIYGSRVQSILQRDHAWLFGNEAHGLASSLVRMADISVRVPVYGRAESLNLAAAAAVCLYESARAVRSEVSPVALEAREGVRR
jgi:TrmH family RNA methyltransferase